MSWLAAVFADDEADTRARLVGDLRLRPGQRVLEVACGSGSNFPAVFEALGGRGELIGADVSPGMLQRADDKVEAGDEARPDGGLTLLLAGAHDLPFVDACFDAVLHVGAINGFDRIRDAIAESVRVVRPGGRVVIADEGLAPWLRETEFGAAVLAHSAEFAAAPPLELLPASARDVSLSWLFGDAFYCLAFRVGEPRSIHQPS